MRIYTTYKKRTVNDTALFNMEFKHLHAHETVTECVWLSSLLEVTVMLVLFCKLVKLAAVIVTEWSWPDEPWMEYVLSVPAATSALETVSVCPWLLPMLLLVPLSAQLACGCGMGSGLEDPSSELEHPIMDATGIPIRTAPAVFLIKVFLSIFIAFYDYCIYKIQILYHFQ